MCGSRRLTDRLHSAGGTAALLSCVLFLTPACDGVGALGEDERVQPLTLMEPADRSETADAVRFMWTGGGSGWYRLQLSTDSSFTVLVRDISSGTVPEHIVRELDRGTIHFWRVRHEHPEGVGAWSVVRSFIPVRKALLPARPNLRTPVHLTIGLPREIIVEWEPVPDAIAYHLQVFMDEDLLLFHADLEELTSSEIPIRDLVFTYPYWWRVRAESVAGYGVWSNVWKFQVKD
ncbi:MAG: hypothetical protein HKN17_00830, partial [Rhodothermales bacterium]|nr:hypothetical protein [Rhodothermales bacterium]